MTPTSKQLKLIFTVIGFASLACILLAEALLQWKYLGTDSKGGNAACVLFIFLFIAMFQVSMVFTLLADADAGKVR